MSKRSLIDQLNEAINARVFGRGTEKVDPKLEVLARIGQDLRLRANEEFKENLKGRISGKGTEMTTATSSKQKGVREGFHTITPYLIVTDAPAVLDFLKQAFEADEKFRAMGSAGGFHCEVRLRDSMLMIGGGGDGSAWKGEPMPQSLHLYVDNVDEVYQRALAAGATSLYPPMDHPYGDRDCGVTDPGGNHWFIAADIGGGNNAQLFAVTPGFRPNDAARFVEFLERGLGATVEARHEDPAGVIVHGKVRIGDSIVEVSEAHGQWQPMPSAMYLYVDDADAWFNRAVAAGAKVVYPLQNHDYGDRSGGVQDSWGNHWYISSQLETATTDQNE